MSFIFFRKDHACDRIVTDMFGQSLRHTVMQISSWMQKYFPWDWDWDNSLILPADKFSIMNGPLHFDTLPRLNPYLPHLKKIRSFKLWRHNLLVSSKM